MHTYMHACMYVCMHACMYVCMVYGSSSSTIAPSRSKDGNSLLRDPRDILNRWREHFDEVLNRPSEINQDFIN